MKDSEQVFVEAPARLHFGMLDLSGSLGRRFGGIGAAVPTPSVLVSAAPAAALSVEAGPECDATEARAAGTRRHPSLRDDGPAREAALVAARATVERLLVHHSVDERRVRLLVHRVIPAHQGLGSGSQLALATARAVAEVYDLPREVSDLARAVGRARRSAIGTYVFGHGGFILEGGRSTSSDHTAPLLTRLPIPPEWQCVIAVPGSRAGLSGDAEAAAFSKLPVPPAHDAERVAHLTLMALLPALVERDFSAFGSTLTEIQRLNGVWFAAAQGGPYAPGPTARLVKALLSWGATGVGQSSWGPAVYALAPDADAGAVLADRVRHWLSRNSEPGVIVYHGPFSHTGARVWRG